MIPVLIFIAFGLGVVALILRDRHRKLAREAFIRDYVFPQGLFTKLQKQHPQLSLKQCQLVSRGLRHFFLTHHKSGLQFVSMPSQVVDDLWHEFILNTREYEAFCKKAFGRFMHHTPAVVLGSVRQANAGLRRCWWWACREENIHPLKPTRLPLLFALDDKLGIAEGFRYSADCDAVRRLNATGPASTIVHCGGDFDSLRFDGSIEGLGPTHDNDASTFAGSGSEGSGSSGGSGSSSGAGAGAGAGAGGSSGGAGASGDGCGGGGCGGD